MRKHLSRAFRPTTLTYSSPAVDTMTPAPTSFYNAFPELNDVAPDESQSAFPKRAKYLLPLDSMFLPCLWACGCRDGAHGFSSSQILLSRLPEVISNRATTSYTLARS